MLPTKTRQQVLTPKYLRAAESLRSNPGQWEAFESQGSRVILAGPGSGKTRLLTTKVARMLAEDVADPQRVACLTYSTECVRELRRRLEELGVDGYKNLFVGTVHSFCLMHLILPYAQVARLALPSPLRVASQRQQRSEFEDVLSQVLGKDEAPFVWRTRVDEYRRTHLDRASPEWMEDGTLANLVDTYERRLHGNGLIDFDDMVLSGLKLVEGFPWVRRAIRARFPIIVIDEYQDLGVPLHRMVASLLSEGVRLFVVGDPDQSIYGFTGARPGLLKELGRREDVKRITLPFNYRSGERLVEAAEVALGEVRGYQAKGEGKGLIFFHERRAGVEDQAEYICTKIVGDALGRRPGRTLGDIAVLYLDKNDGQIIADAATAQGLDIVRLDAGAPYKKTPLVRWVEDCARWCAGGWEEGKPRLASLCAEWLNLNRTVAGEKEQLKLRRELTRFLFSQRNGEQIADTWLAELEKQLVGEMLRREASLSDEGEAFGQLRQAYNLGGPLQDLTVRALGRQAGSKDHLNLITLHSAKGLEFDVVVMMGMDQGRIPRWKTSESQKREARRLFYVGLTRARHEVHLTYSGWTENQYGRRFENGPCEFLLEVKEMIDS